MIVTAATIICLEISQHAYADKHDETTNLLTVKSCSEVISTSTIEAIGEGSDHSPGGEHRDNEDGNGGREQEKGTSCRSYKQEL